MWNYDKKKMKLFSLMLIFLCAWHNSEGALCELSGTDTGDVFEYAPTNTLVWTATYEGTVGVNYTLSLDPNLDSYFSLNGDELVVKSGVNITRNSASGKLIKGKITCSLSPSNSIPKELVITIKNINSVNPPIFTSANTASIGDGSSIGDNVLTVKATDEDTTSISYKINLQEPPDVFKLLSSSSPTLQVNQAIVSLDPHNVTIEATSTGKNNIGGDSIQRVETTVMVTIIDDDNHPPEFIGCTKIGDICYPPLYSASVVYGDTNVTFNGHTIEAKDLDVKVDSPITFSLPTGQPTDYGDYFEINSGTGIVTMKKPVLESSGISQFSMTVLAVEGTGKYSITSLTIDAAKPPDQHKPVVTLPAGVSVGYVQASTSGSISYVTDDEAGMNPIIISVTDADATGEYFYEVTSPYDVTKNGYLIYDPLGTTAPYADAIKIVAVNIAVDSLSPNRKSDPISITVNSVTTPEPTTMETTQPMTTQATTEQVTTPGPTTMKTTQPVTTQATTEQVTTPPATTMQATTVGATTQLATSEATTQQTTGPDSTAITSVGTTSGQQTTQTSQATQTTAITSVETTSDQQTTQTSQATQTAATTPGSTIAEVTSAATTESTPVTQVATGSTQQSSSMSETTQLATSNVMATTSQEQTTHVASTTNQSKTAETSSTDQSTTKNMMTTSGQSQVTTPADTTSQTSTQLASSSGQPHLTTSVSSSSPDSSTADINNSNPTVPNTAASSTTMRTTTTKPPPCEATTSYNGGVIAAQVPATTLYAVAGSLGAALAICLIVLAYFVYKYCKKTKDNDDDEKVIDENLSENGAIVPVVGFTSHENEAFDGKNESINGDIIQTDDKEIERENDSGTEVNSYQDVNEVDEEPALDDESDHDSHHSNQEEETEEPSAPDEDDDNSNAGLLLAAAAVTTAVVASNHEHENVVPLATDEEFVQDYGSAYINNDVRHEEYLKTGKFGSLQMVTIQKYGNERRDKLAVVHKFKLDKISYTEKSSLETRIRLLKKVCEQEHTNILQFYGNYEDSDEIHYAMSYAEKGNLQDYLQKNRSKITATQLLHFLSGAGRGLQYLHLRNIIHCHLQAKFVMIDSELNPMLTDFENNEIAVVKEGDRERWQALEILNGDLSSKSTDIWSFGVLMWEIISLGSTPYEDLSVGTGKIKEYLESDQRLQKPTGCSEEMFDIMETCWDAKPRQRPDIYLINSNLDEKLTEDPDELLRMDMTGDVTIDDVAIDVPDYDEEDITAF